MSWVIASVGLGAGGAGIGYFDAKQKQKQEQDALQANAVQIQYSPWTHMAANVKGATAGSPTLAAVKGGIQGGMTGAMMAAGNPAAAAGAGGGLGSTDQMMPTNAASSTFGSGQMSNQLGAQSNNAMMNQQASLNRAMATPYQAPQKPTFFSANDSNSFWNK